MSDKPIVETVYADRLNSLTSADAWLPIEFHALFMGTTPVLGVKAQLDTTLKLPDGTTIRLYNWSLLRITPDQLRALATALEQPPPSAET